VEGGVEEQRQRLLATLADWAIGTARAQPMVIAFEDLHWSDPSSLELQKVLVEQTATAPIMLATPRGQSFARPGRCERITLKLPSIGFRSARSRKWLRESRYAPRLPTA
jgi:hypothetical protein